MIRHKHSLSHTKLTTFNQGQLIPVGLVEVLPGDSFQHSTSALLRFAPLLAPIMHQVEARIHHWFVPHRLVWEDWEDFITGGPDNDDASVFPTMNLSVSGATAYSLEDYYGLPVQSLASPSDYTFSALPIRGYDLIFNEFYRDQDLVTPLTVDVGSGPDTTSNRYLQYIAWEKDYFTTARPWAQKGSPGVIPGGEIDASGTFRLKGASAPGGYDVYAKNNAGVGYFPYNSLASIEAAEYHSGLEITGATINELKVQFALQRYAEARAQYGSRYTEYLAYLGVKSSDARLQRPEYLGGGKNLMQVSEVLQTGVTTDGDDEEGVGEMKGHGIGSMKSNRYRRFFEEHGYVHSFVSVKPKTIYANGFERHWNRRTKEDFFQKELQYVGQQEILNKEVQATATATTFESNATWGYQDRYDEYRQAMSGVTGEFRSALAFWHQARLFGTTATPLNSAFVTSSPTDRIYATAGAASQVMGMFNHSLQARRMVGPGGRILSL